MLKPESVTVIHVPKEPPGPNTQYKLKFALRHKITQRLAFEMIFNSFFGVHFINHHAFSETQDHIPEEIYLDVDLDIQRTSDKIFLTMHDEKIYISVGGLSFADVIYTGDFYTSK